MGLGRNEGKVFIIDFGLSNYYQDQTGKHIGYNEDASFHGTHRYASVNSHFKVGKYCCYKSIYIVVLQVA